MICPVCKSDMIVVEYRDIELDYCTECQGVWFDSGELELMLNSYHTEGIEKYLEDIKNAPDAQTKEKRRKCPVCGRKMGKKAIGGQPRILIDTCEEEHGLWFDGGEIDQLRGQIVGKTKTISGTENEAISFLGELFNTP